VRAFLKQNLELLTGLAEAHLAGADRGFLCTFQLKVFVRNQAAP
jgi:hypothetical protein